MFRKLLTVAAAAAMMSAPLATYAQSTPARAPVVVAQPKAPAATPRQSGMEALLAVGAVAVIVGILAKRH
ncbi:hypothetical protein Q4555_08710 [Octadecabacter sp. 1_MG-2023]|uniref:hypothetical protein n=1 Tax=unclassified Octadecabacter TaxID=196158 RepID=UPI001C08AC0C|nr:MULTISPECIES: hypothetical protein [unclassified Octadecabacter]MBU2992493.1 hypothetical protein [Octadecabacter sp. B2R22]MDO6734750.1 hypothetical protein [Octadecabacter sp. 1_MG-2023]